MHSITTNAFKINPHGNVSVGGRVSINGSGTGTMLTNAGTLNVRNGSTGGVVIPITNNSAGTINVDSGSTVSGSIALQNSGTITVGGSTVGTISAPITNNSSGIINVNNHGILSGVVTNSGELKITTGGTVSEAINFGVASGAKINISGGTMSGNIVGYTTGGAVDSNIVNINGAFTTGGSIGTVGTINVPDSAAGVTSDFQFKVANQIIANTFNITNRNYGKVVVDSGGSITGSGANMMLTNSGVLTLGSSNGSINIPITNNRLAKMYVNSGGDLSGSCSLINSGALTVGASSPGGASSVGVVSVPITNNPNGIINVYNGGVISGTNSLINKGIISLTAGGVIDVPMVFDTTYYDALSVDSSLFVKLNVSGGVIKQPTTTVGTGTIGVSIVNDAIVSSDLGFTSITLDIGVQDVKDGNGNIIVAGIPASFVTGNDIANAGIVNVNKTKNPSNFTINNNISNVNNFTSLSGTITIINDGGDISGKDSTSSITNSGSITINSGGYVGGGNAIGTASNQATFKVNGGYVIVNSFTNNNSNAVLNITNGVLESNSIRNTLSNTSGGITISGGDLSSLSSRNRCTLINGSLSSTIAQIITVSGTGTIGNTIPLGDVTNYGVFTVSGTAAVNIGAFNNNNTLVTATSSNPAFNITSGNVNVSGTVTNTAGFMTISGGDLSSSTASTLTNTADQTVTVSGSGTIGAHGALGTVTNNGMFVASGGAVNIGAFTNNNTTTTGLSANNPAFNITSGNMAVSGTITNTAGFMTISGGDLSSTSFSNRSPLINGTAQVITVSGTGTIGNTIPLGGVTNYGVFTVGGGAVNIGAFTNNNTTTTGLTAANPAFNITSGNVNVSGTVTNTAGFMTISGGDLSSSTASTLTNTADQTVTVSGSGTIGAHGALGTVTNNGMFVASGGAVNIGAFTNNNTTTTGLSANNPAFNITSGNMAVSGTITNTAGFMTISGGDLSSAIGTSNTLTNEANQTITISGGAVVGGTIGKIRPLGDVNNYGMFVAGGGIIKVNRFYNNNSTGTLNTPALSITSGNIVITDTISNIAGYVTIANGADLSGANSTSSNLINAAGQTITLSGGTIGAAVGSVGSRFGYITNYGVVNINDSTSSMTASNFTNNNSNAILQINNGAVKIGSLTNTLGSIQILGGDLSSINGVTSSLTNGVNQTIEVSGGTMGAAIGGSLGSVTNYGVIKVDASTSQMIVGAFTNNNTNAILNISNGTVKTGNIKNTLGRITISGGDLSSANIGSVHSNLTNAAGQTITLSGGTIGAAAGASLGSVTNYGVIKVNATTSSMSVGTFSNNNTNAVFEITGGTVNTRALTNMMGKVSVFGGTVSIAGGVTNNGIFAINAPITVSGNFVNGVNGIVNVGADFNIGHGNTFINNGKVNVLNTAAITNGNYTVAETGAHIVNIYGDGSSSKLTIDNGSLVLSQNSIVDVNIVGDFLIRNQQSFTIMSVPAGGITKGGDVHCHSGSELMSYQILVNGNDVELVANRNSISDIIGVGDEPETITIVKALDDLIDTGVFGDLKTAIAKLLGLASKQEMIDAVTQLSPDTHIIPETWFVGPSMVFSAISERADLIARAGIDNIQTGYAAGGMQANNGAWIKGLGGSINQCKRLDFAGYSANTVGLAFGLDEQIFEDTWLGVSFSSVGTHANGKDISASKTNMNSRQLTFYGSYSPNDYYVDSFVAMAFNNYKLTRSILYNGLNQTAVAEYNATQPSVKVASGYIFGLNNGFRIIPNLSLQYSVLRQNIYNETGAGGLSLQQVNNSALTQLEGGIGVKFSVLHNEDGQIYNPDIHFMVLHDFKSAAQITTAQFLGGGGSFSVQGSVPDKTTYNTGFGFTFIHKDRLHFTLNYDLRIKNKYIGHAGSLAIRYEI